jgi:hypothetical protein
MVRPLGSQNKDKPFREALRKEAKSLESGNVETHPMGSLRWNAQQLLMIGNSQSIREVADRLDGKVPQAIGGTDELPPIKAIAWLETLTPAPATATAKSSASTTDPEASSPASTTAPSDSPAS